MRLDNLEGHNNYYDTDGTPLKFSVQRLTIHHDGVKIILDKLPYLVNEQSDQVFFSIPAAQIIKEYITNAKKDGKLETKINQLGRFNRGKFPAGEKTRFKYSPAEHYFIPGLIKNIPSDGYLTPVYFESHVLLKFEHANGYRLEKYTKSVGRIHGPNGINIPYGVNAEGYVIMWLGDVVDFPEKELFYLYSANVEPQYNIHSDFYRNQILGEWL